MLFGRREGRFTPDRRRYITALLREWIALELLGHVGLIVLRQICGTWWSWSTGGPFAYLDVSRAMLHGDFFWVIAVVCTSAIRSGLLAEWGQLRAKRLAFGALAWLPWLVPGCIVGWVVLIRNDDGAAYILALPYGSIFEGYHVLFFGYVAARIAACALQLALAARLLLHRSRRALTTDGPWPYIPVGVALVAGIAVLCAVVYLHIYQQGGSFQARWEWFAPEQL
jgi:hypothetical protein